MAETLRDSGKRTTVFTIGIGEVSPEERASRWAIEIDSVRANLNLDTGGVPKVRSVKNNGEIIIEVNTSAHNRIIGPKGKRILEVGEIIILQKQLPDIAQKKAKKNKDKKSNGNRRRRSSKR